MATSDGVDRPAQLGADGAPTAAAGLSAAGHAQSLPNLCQGGKTAQKKAAVEEGRRSEAWNELDRRAMLRAGLDRGSENRSGSSATRSPGELRSCRFSFGGSAPNLSKRFFASTRHSKDSESTQIAPAPSAAGANGPVCRRAASTQPSSAPRHSHPPPLPPTLLNTRGAGHWVRGICLGAMGVGQ